jgi:hypothetical protein
MNKTWQLNKTWQSLASPSTHPAASLLQDAGQTALLPTSERAAVEAAAL